MANVASVMKDGPALIALCPSVFQPVSTASAFSLTCVFVNPAGKELYAMRDFVMHASMAFVRGPKSVNVSTATKALIVIFR